MQYFWLLVEYIAVVGGGGLILVYGLHGYRRWEQKKMDASRITYRLRFPADVTLDSAALLFSNLSGMLKKPLKVAGQTIPNLLADPTISIEILSTPEHLVYLMSFPKGFERSVRGGLLGTFHNLNFEEVVQYPSDWNHVIELNAGRANFEPDPSKIQALLSSFRELEEGEAVAAQFIFRPVHFTSLDADVPNFHVIGRLAARSPNPIRARILIKDTGYQYGNLQVATFKEVPKHEGNKVMNERRSPHVWPALVTAKALAVVAGLPINNPQVPGLDPQRGRHLPPASIIPSEGIVLGTSNYIAGQRPIAATKETLLHHQWLIGTTGQGKSTLLHWEAKQIMEAGYGLVLLEPDGRLSRAVLDSVPHERRDDVIWFDPTDTERPIGFNILGGHSPDRVASYTVSLFKSWYGDSWGPRLEQVLRNATLMAAMNGLTLYDVKHLLVNPEFRARILRQTKSVDLRNFWRRFDDGADSAFDSVLNKLDAVVGDEMLRYIVGQQDGLDIADVVNNNKILIVPLDREAMGESNAAILGSTVVSRLWREIQLRKSGTPVILMLDEFQNYIDQSIESMFDEARKYDLGLIVANQRIKQLEKRSSSMLSAVEANATTKIVFSVEPKDAKALAPHFTPLDADNIHHLGRFEAALSLWTGQGKAPTVTMSMSAPPAPTGVGWAALAASRGKYGVPLAEVKALLEERHKIKDKPERPSFGPRKTDGL